MAIPAEMIKISDTVWELPVTFKEGMRVPARIIATEKLLAQMDDGVFDQVTNVATLPGILKYAYCMPDGHWGYGFPIGGVAAMDTETGVISPGGIGFDINCGMRLVTTNLQYEEVRPHLHQLVDRLFTRVPTGVGCRGFVRLSPDEFREVIEQGASWCIEKGYGWPEDLRATRRTVESPAPMPARSATGRWNGAISSWVPWDRAIIIWKSRWSDRKTSSIRFWPGPSGSLSPTRW